MIVYTIQYKVKGRLNMKQVLVLGTGGTIASTTTDNGLTPNEFSSEIARELELFQPHFDITFENIMNLDSSNIQSEEWLTIARTLYENLPIYEGIIVLHGTDTMAYTASMISYMLQGINKPIVFTGSQTPAGTTYSDATSNLATAFEAIAKHVIGVTIAFNNKLICGTRAVKVRTKGFHAFESINAPYRGEVFADGLEVYPYSVPKDANTDFILQDNICNDVFLLKLIPGTNPLIFDAITNLNYRGIVIETFGAGGMHYIRRDLLQSIERLIKRGIVVVICSQCLYEASNLSIYEVGKKLLSTGVISAGDMATEAIVTKLMWALGQTTDVKRVREMFEKNYTGEIATD